MFKRFEVQCKLCKTPFTTSENRVKAGRGKFCSKKCSCSFNSKKHGHAANGLSPTYSTWASMLQRCNNKSAGKFYAYGAVGIDVCATWVSFTVFLTDMGERPKGKTLDRIDGTKGYSKENCRWATSSEQQSNLKNNVVVEYNGQSFTLSQLSRHLGLHWTTLKYRISAGWPQTKWSLPTKKNRSLILSSAD